MSRPQALKRFVTVAVLVSLCTATFVSTNTRAAHKPFTTTSNTKISPDLQKLILSGNGDARVKVIVQSKTSSPSLLGGLLNTVGGLLVSVLSNLNIRIVKLKPTPLRYSHPIRMSLTSRSTQRSPAQVTSQTQQEPSKSVLRNHCSV